MLTINFAAQQGEVLCYPDLVKVSVALDNGRVVGFESEGYLMNHTLRDLPRSPVSLGKAQAALSPALDILTHRLALIPTGGEYEAHARVQVPVCGWPACSGLYQRADRPGGKDPHSS